MKKIAFFIILLLFGACTNVEKKEKQAAEVIIKEFEEAYPMDKFHFLYGPDYDGSIGRTNIRYRAILSSEKLEELDYYNGFQINMEDLGSYIDTRKYQNTLNYLEVYAPLKREAKEIFGEGIIFEIDGTYTSAKFNHYLDNMGSDVELKPSLGIVMLSTFVDDLDKELENIDIWKERIYQLGKKYWEYYNAKGALQIYIYDKELLYENQIVEASLNFGAREKKDVIKVLEKLEEGKELNKEELEYILLNISKSNVFIKEIVRLSLEKYVVGIRFWTDEMKDSNELSIDNAEVVRYRGNSN